MAALPAPMLARSGRLPTESGYAFELKWDGFRALVRCGSDFRVRSRRGWNMTALLPELRESPVDAVLDGELVALGDDGWPDFPSACDRILNGKASIPLLYVVFDVLELDGRSTTHLPFRERRGLLEGSACTGRTGRTQPSSTTVKRVGRGRTGARARGRGCEALEEQLPLRRAWLGQDEEPRVSAVGGRARGRDPGSSARAAVGRPTVATPMEAGSAPEAAAGSAWPLASAVPRDQNPVDRRCTRRSYAT